MASYLFVLFNTGGDQLANFAELRRQLSPPQPDLDLDITHRLYLNSAEELSIDSKHRYANIYRFTHLANPSIPQIRAYLQSIATSKLHTIIHWRIYSSLAETSKLQLSLPTIVTVEMTIPTDSACPDELDKWYSQEHIPALATVPGWQAAARMKLVHASTEGGTEYATPAPYLALHEWAEPNELGGEIWKKAILTPGTKRVEEMQTAPMERRVWRAA